MYRSPLRRSMLIASVAVASAAVGLGSAGLASAAGPASAPPVSAPDAGSSTEGTITVNGTGQVTVEPDTGHLSVGVQANAATGTEAMEQVTVDSNDLTAAIEAAGVDPTDIQTSGLNLWTTTNVDGSQITGYQASLSVDITVRNLDDLGAIIDAAQVAVGDGFTIGGVSFSFSDPESVLEQARVAAVQNARTIAEQYAAASGVSLGGMVALSETPTGYSPIMFARAEPAATDSQSLAISPGTLDLSVQITVTYATA